MNPSYPQIEFTFTHQGAGMTIIFKYGNDRIFLDGLPFLYYILISQVSLISQVGQYFLINFKTERFLCVK